MKEHSQHHKAHPHHRGAGLSAFHSEHWEKHPGDTSTADGKYGSGEMSNAEDYKHSVDSLAAYAKKHKAQH